MKDQDGVDRCEVCGWPLTRTAADGCMPGNCSQRPVPRPTYIQRAFTVHCGCCHRAHVANALPGMTVPEAHEFAVSAARAAGWLNAGNGLWACHECWGRLVAGTLDELTLRSNEGSELLRAAVASAPQPVALVALLKAVRAWVAEDVGRDLLPAERQLWDAWHALPEPVRALGEP